MPLERYTCTEPFQASIQCRQIVDTVQCYAYADTICFYENQSYRFSLFGTCRNQVVNETIVIPLNETYGKNIYCYMKEWFTLGPLVLLLPKL
jgi:hypothetical protein